MTSFYGPGEDQIGYSVSAVKIKNRKMLDREDAEQVDACTMQD